MHGVVVEFVYRHFAPEHLPVLFFCSRAVERGQIPLVRKRRIAYKFEYLIFHDGRYSSLFVVKKSLVQNFVDDRSLLRRGHIHIAVRFQHNVVGRNVAPLERYHRIGVTLARVFQQPRVSCKLSVKPQYMPSNLFQSPFH